MKIKRKVELNLSQLIEWLLKSGKSEYIVISNMNNTVRLEPYGVIRFSQEKFYSEETFTVEVEEEITEDTEIDKLVVIDDDDDLLVFSNYTIREIKNNDFKEFHAYIDGEFKLVWRNGKLVE